MWKPSSKHLVAAIGLCAFGGVATLLLAPQASAHRFDPALPQHATVGKPTGAAPMARVEATRTGRGVELPDTPRELWARTVRGGVELPILVDDKGAIVVAGATAELAQLTAEGNEQWRVRLGVSGPSAGPVLTSDGTRLTLTSMGEAWGLSPTGTVRYRTDLSPYGRDPRVAPLPRDDGSVVIAVGSNIVVIGADGAVKSNTPVGEALVGALVATKSGIVATTEPGNVYLWSPPLAPRRLGSFKGQVRDGAAVADDQTLVAVVDRRRLVAFDLRTGQLDVRSTGVNLEGPPTVAPGGVAYVTTASGLLLGSNPSGEVLRAALVPQPTGLEDAGTPSYYYRNNPPMLADGAGRIAFARTDGKVGVVSDNARLRMAASSGCSDPVALAPAGPRQFLVACRSGSLRLFGP